MIIDTTDRSFSDDIFRNVAIGIQNIENTPKVIYISRIVELIPNSSSDGDMFGFRLPGLGFCPLCDCMTGHSIFRETKEGNFLTQKYVYVAWHSLDAEMSTLSIIIGIRVLSDIQFSAMVQRTCRQLPA